MVLSRRKLATAFLVELEVNVNHTKTPSRAPASKALPEVDVKQVVTSFVIHISNLNTILLIFGVDFCDVTNCLNGGTCIRQVNGTSCDCTSLFVGDFCETG